MADNSQEDAKKATGDVRRFAVLRHIDDQGTHFDLLIEAGEKLATWKFSEPPESATAAGSPCRRIPDHRYVYLEYEGPISGDRGHVTRQDEGTCSVHVCEDARWEVTFRGQSLSGRFVISQSETDAVVWSLRRL